MKRLLSRAFIVVLATACSSSSYIVKDPRSGKELQNVSADAPGGETFVLIVYYSADKAPIVQAGGDSTALVEATAAAGRRAVAIALKAARGVP
jgi:hypothetical protein